jgi:hypothetical protein
MKIASHRIRFSSILGVLGLIYISLSFLTGETFLGMPNNWFISWMAQISQQMDKVGFFNVWAGQSPGFNYLYYILWKPASALADGQYYFALTFALMWGFLSIGALFLSAYLFYKIVENLWGEEKGLILGTIYILFFLTMPRWYEVIDSITIAGLLGAIFCWLKGHNKVGGVILGITAAFKPFGLVVLPILLKSEFLTWKVRLTTIAVIVLSFIIVILPFAINNFPIFMSSFNWQSGRPPWETVYAFSMWLLDKPYPDNTFFYDSSGVSLKDWGQTGITPYPSVMTTPVPGGNNWYNGTFTILFILVVVAFVLLKRVRTKEDILTGGLCLLTLHFGLFYGWSLQFTFWLIPFLLITFRIAVPIIFRLIVLLEYPFFYALYMAAAAPSVVTAAPGLTVGMTAALAPIGVAVYWSLIFLRTTLILAFGVIAWMKLPTQFWNPVYDILGLISIRQRLKTNTQANRGEG